MYEYVTRGTCTFTSTTFVVVAFLAACHPHEVSLAPLPPVATARYLEGRLAAYRGDWPTAASALADAAAAAPDQPMIAIALAHALAKAKREPAARDVLASARARWPDHPQVWLASGDLLASALPIDGTAPSSGGAAGDGRATAVDGTAPSSGGAAGDGQATAVDGTAPSSGGVAGDGQATAVDGTAPSSGGAAGDGQATAVDGTAPSSGGARATAEAAAAYRRAISLAPDNERGYLGLARVLLAGHHERAAEDTLRSLIAHVPASVDGHFRLAQRLADRDDLAGAAKELRAVLERDPDHIDARMALARAERRLGDLTDAIAQTRSAFDRAAQPIDLAQELFFLLCEAGDITAAKDLLTLLDDDRSDPDTLGLVARLELGLGAVDVAHVIASQLASIDADAAALVEIEIAAGTHDLDAAERLALALPADSPVYGAGRRVAADAIRASHGAPARAFALVEPAWRARPGDLDLALSAALALAGLHRGDEARAALAAVKAAPALELARARLDDALGDDKAAIARVEALIRAHPDDAAALNFAGYLMVDTGARLEVAARYLKTARELQPGDPAIIDSWGWLLLRRGDREGALAALELAAALAPLDRDIALHLRAARAPTTSGQLVVPSKP